LMMHSKDPDQDTSIDLLDKKIRRLRKESSFQYVVILLLTGMVIWVLNLQQDLDVLILDRLDRLEREVP